MLRNSVEWDYYKSLSVFMRERGMDRTVARLNIEHYRRLLARETDETRRQTIVRLLTEEESKLADPAPNEKKCKAH